MSEIATGKLVIWMRLQAKRITPDGNSTSIMLSAAADRLESQEQTIAALTARAEQAERERDAAKAYMKRFGCLTCEGQGTVGLNEPCWGCRDKSNWKMRGLQPQDGGAE